MSLAITAVDHAASRLPASLPPTTTARRCRSARDAARCRWILPCATPASGALRCATKASVPRACRRCWSPAASPPAATSRRSATFPDAGWWQAQVGAGRALDPAGMRILCDRLARRRRRARRADRSGRPGRCDRGAARCARHRADSQRLRRLLVRRDGRPAVRRAASATPAPAGRDQRHAIARIRMRARGARCSGSAVALGALQCDETARPGAGARSWRC